MTPASGRTPERGEIWSLTAGPAVRPARRRTQEVLVVQCPELLHERHPSTLVIPLTTDLIEDAEPLRIRIAPGGRLRYAADLMVDQIFALDTARLQQGPLLRLDNSMMTRVEDALREVLGLIS